MISTLTKSEFLRANRISDDDWDRAAIDWELLRAIGVEFESRRPVLERDASYIANVIQGFEGVHSVRLRIKDPQHLLEKIVRKRAAGSNAYADIAVGNYKKIITDLIGIRALHLLKPDCIGIYEKLKETWPSSLESPTAYTRKGDSAILGARLQEAGFEVREHAAGYRSLHYVFSVQQGGQDLIVETQIRTLFEEAWSEVDHRVRYPNHSSDTTLEYFLGLFNRFSGSADEMGSFVFDLQTKLSTLEAEAQSAYQQRDESFKKIDGLLGELQASKNQTEDSQRRVAELKKELTKLRREEVTRAPSPKSDSWATPIIATQLSTAALADYVARQNAFKVLGDRIDSRGGVVGAAEFAVLAASRRDELERMAKLSGVFAATESSLFGTTSASTLSALTASKVDELSKLNNVAGVLASKDPPLFGSRIAESAVLAATRHDELERMAKLSGVFAATESSLLGTSSASTLSALTASKVDELSKLNNVAGVLASKDPSLFGSRTAELGVLAASQRDEFERLGKLAEGLTAAESAVHLEKKMLDALGNVGGYGGVLSQAESMIEKLRVQDKATMGVTGLAGAFSATEAGVLKVLRDQERLDSLTKK